MLFKDSEFKKSSFSTVWEDLCVEVAMKDEHIAVRDSKNKQQDCLVFNKGEWLAFIKGIKNGEFDV